jgi:hypothetical protein
MKVIRLKPYNEPPADVGTFVVSVDGTGNREIRVVTANGVEVLARSSLRDPDGLERMIQNAIDLATPRGVTAIYVQGDLNV